MAVVEVLFLLVYAIAVTRGQSKTHDNVTYHSYLLTAVDQCTVPDNPVLDSSDLDYLSNCNTIYGDLVLGYQNCDQTCLITDLSRLSDVRTIDGSLTIQCCNTLDSIPTLYVNTITGSFTIYYNNNLRSISNLDNLATVGSLVISQNPSLQTISGFSNLQVIGGHLVIEYNPVLTDVTGLDHLATIRGTSLVNGHALVLLYNRVLTDISGLKSLSSISYGTVHIEGNEELCYAGYPLWGYGSYNPRYETGDKGIDWRTKLSISWQYTWGDEEAGQPTLLIRDNGNQTTCGKLEYSSATLYSSSFPPFSRGQLPQLVYQRRRMPGAQRH